MPVALRANRMLRDAPKRMLSLAIFQAQEFLACPRGIRFAAQLGIERGEGDVRLGMSGVDGAGLFEFTNAFLNIALLGQQAPQERVRGERVRKNSHQLASVRQALYGISTT